MMKETMDSAGGGVKEKADVAVADRRWRA